MPYKGTAYHWVYKDSKDKFCCIFIAADSIILPNFRDILEKWGDWFFPIAK